MLALIPTVAKAPLVLRILRWVALELEAGQIVEQDRTAEIEQVTPPGQSSVGRGPAGGAVDGRHAGSGCGSPAPHTPPRADGAWCFARTNAGGAAARCPANEAAGREHRQYEVTPGRPSSSTRVVRPKRCPARVPSTGGKRASRHPADADTAPWGLAPGSARRTWVSTSPKQPASVRQSGGFIIPPRRRRA